MTVTITLPDEVAGELQREAERRGIEPQHVAAEIIASHLPSSERARALQSLFAQWAAEDVTTDASELDRRKAEWEEMKHALNANRSSGRKLFAE